MTRRALVSRPAAFGPYVIKPVDYIFGVMCMLLLLALPASVLSHGNMVVPYTWQDTAGLVGMTAGATCLPGLGLTNVAPGVRVGTSCMWFNNDTRIPGEPTLDPAMRTFWFYSDEGVEVDVYTNRPWRAPGTAPLHSPCGVAGKIKNKSAIIFITLSYTLAYEIVISRIY